MAETRGGPRKWLSALLGAVLALAVGTVSSLPLLLSDRFRDARTAYWALGQPGVESVDVGGAITKIHLAEDIDQVAITNLLTKVKTKQYVWLIHGGIEVWDVEEVTDPLSFGEALWRLGRDGDFEGVLQRSRDAAGHGGLLSYTGPAADCRDEIRDALEYALRLPTGWQDLGAYCAAEDENYLVRIDTSERAASALELLAAQDDQLGDVMIDLSEEDRINITAADPADFDTIRDTFLTGLGAEDWRYFMVQRGVDGVTIRGTDDASAAIKLADELTAAGLDPRFIVTDFEIVRVVDEGLDQIATVSELVPPTADLDLRRSIDNIFYSGPAAELAPLAPTLLTIDRSGTSPSWNTSSSTLYLNLPAADHACEQTALSCAELAAAIAALPAPVNVEVRFDGSSTKFVARPGEPAAVTERGGIGFATELIAAWDARG